MSVEEIKEATIQFIRQNYKDTGRTSSLKNMCKNVEGLNKRNFYKIFESVEQAHKLADVPYDKSRIEKMQKVRKNIGIKSTKSAKRGKPEPEKEENIQLEKPETEGKEVIQHEQQDPHPLDPQIYTLIRYQGTRSREEALSQAIETQHSFNPYILNHGLKTPKELVKYFDDSIQLERDKVMDLEIENKISRSLSATYQETIAELKDSEDGWYDEGYQDGEKEHAILVPCVGCGQPITILPGTECHKIIIEVLRENGIIHKDCKPSYQRVYTL